LARLIPLIFVAEPDDALSVGDAADTAVPKRGAPGLVVPRQDLLRFLLIGVLGVAASNYLYYLAIQRTNVATAIILQYTAPVWVLLYTVCPRRGQGRHCVAPRAVALVVAGCVLAVGFHSGGVASKLDTVGVIAALLAAFSFAFYNVGGHDVLARYDRWKVLLWVLASAATFWMFVNPPWKIWAAHYGRAAVGIHADLFAGVCAGSVLVLLRRTPASGANARRRGQLPGAGVQHRDRPRAALGELLRPLRTLGIVVVLVAIVLIQLPERASPGGELVVEPIE